MTACDSSIDRTLVGLLFRFYNIPVIMNVISVSVLRDGKIQTGCGKEIVIYKGKLKNVR